MSKEEKKAILDRIDVLEEILDSWGFYKNPVGIREIKRELEVLYGKLEK